MKPIFFFPLKYNRLPPLRPSHVLSAFFFISSIHQSKKSILLSTGRECLFLALKLADIGPGDSILCPDFTCDVTLFPIKHLGIKIKFYPITLSLSPDLDAVKRLITPDTKALIYVNYFGFYKDIENYLSFGDQYPLVVIEDNAHGSDSLYIDQSSSQSTPLGRLGHMGFTSYWKTFPIPLGAELFLNRKELATKWNKNKNRLINNRTYKIPSIKLLRFIIRSILSLIQIPLPYIRKNFYEDLPNPQKTRDDFFSPALLSPFLTNFIYYFKQMEKQNRSKRRAIYNIWKDFCLQKGLQSIFPSLPQGVSPMIYPAYARDFNERQKWIRWGARHGIDIYPWPSLPDEVLKIRSSNALRIWEKILCFPIHQEMATDILKETLKTLENTI